MVGFHGSRIYKMEEKVIMLLYHGVQPLIFLLCTVHKFFEKTDGERAKYETEQKAMN